MANVTISRFTFSVTFYMCRTGKVKIVCAGKTPASIKKFCEEQNYKYSNIMDAYRNVHKKVDEYEQK